MMTNRIFKVMAFAVFMACAPYSAAEELSPEKQADIERLMTLTNALAIGKQMSDHFSNQVWKSIKTMRPDLPPRLFDVLQAEVSGVIDESLPALVQVMVPLYHKHFTHEEIKGLIRFYGTDLGVKIIEVMPALMGESMALGQQWGEALAPKIQHRILQRLEAEGIDLSA